MRTTERFQSVRENTRKQLRKMKRKVFVVLAGFIHCRLCLFVKLRIKKTSLPVFISLLVKKKKSHDSIKSSDSGSGGMLCIQKAETTDMMSQFVKIPPEPRATLSPDVCAES